MKQKVSPNLISFVTIRRGDWVMKISIFKSKFVMVIAQNYYDKDSIIIRNFIDQNDAANFIEFLARDDI
jgi:hypothetical protein